MTQFPPLIDPLEFWRKALSDMESSGNTVSLKWLQSPEGADVVQRVAQAQLSMQNVVEKAISAYLKGLNLPSRADIVALAEQMQRIEDKLDALQPPERSRDVAARPARTRQPPQQNHDAPAPVAEAVPEPADKRPAAKRPAVKRASTRKAAPSRRS